MKKITLLVLLLISATLTSLADNRNINQIVQQARRQQQAQQQSFTPEMKLCFAQKLIDNFYVDPVDSATMDAIVQDAKHVS